MNNVPEWVWYLFIFQFAIAVGVYRIERSVHALNNKMNRLLFDNKRS